MGRGEALRGRVSYVPLMERARRLVTAPELRAPLLAGCVGLVVQLLYLATLEAESLHGFGAIRDSLYYDLRASQIAAGDLIGRTAEHLSPLYCLVLGLMKLVGLESPAALRVGQAGLAALCCALVAWLAQRWFGKVAGGIAGVGFALYPPFTYYAAQILPTTVVVLFNLLVLVLYPAESVSPRRGRLLATGFVGGLTALAKANALLLIVVLVLGHVALARRGERRRAWAAALLIGVGATLAIAPVTLKNALVTGRLVPITTSAGANLVKGNGPRANGSHVFLERSERTGAGLHVHLRGIAARDPVNVVTASRRVTRETLAFMRENPRRTLRLFARKFYFFWHDRELVVRDDYPAARRGSWALGYPYLSYGMLVALAAFGAALVRWRRDLWPLAALLAVQAASFTLIFVLARYRLVAAALLFILFAGGAVRAWTLLRERGWMRLIVAAVIAVVVAIVTMQPLPELTAPPTDAGAPRARPCPRG